MKNGRRSILINLETMGSEKKRIIQMEILIKIWLIKLIVPLKMISKKQLYVGQKVEDEQDL